MVYIDSEFRCHASDDGTMTAVETDFFDGKSRTYIEGYRFIPKGKTWVRTDGARFEGEMALIAAEYSVLVNAQREASMLSEAGAAQVQARMTETGSAPEATTGIFVGGVNAWEPGKEYAKNDLFRFKGAMGYVKQAHTSQETWMPFTAGTEALYGARPAPDADGVYPYVYNMAASEGMLVRGGDGVVWRCIQKIESMIYEPGMLPAHFEEA